MGEGTLFRAHGDEQPHIGMILEQTLGHVTHGRNIRDSLNRSLRADISFADLEFEPQHRLHRFPPASNWTVRSGLSARAAVRTMERTRPLDALFVHSQVPAMLLGSVMRRIPAVVSLDATPMQIDHYAKAYNHEVGDKRIELLKREAHARCFRRATSLVTWSSWAAGSLVDDYGVEPERITVIPPGVDTQLWRRRDQRVAGQQLVRILFVGGSFERKGGDLLLESYRRLIAGSRLAEEGLSLELHLVTQGDPPPMPGVHVHRGLTPNSPALVELFQRCDVFCLPTRADCTPLVLAEAAAAGLPTITTAVGAVGESVLDGTTGHIVTPDVDSVHQALSQLVFDEGHRLTLGRKARDHALHTMDARVNSERILDEVLRLVDSSNRASVLTVSGLKASNIDVEIEAKARPLADYVAISRSTDSHTLDWSVLEREASLATRLVRRVAGRSVALAHHLHVNRHRYHAVITDGEQVGLPLAVMLRLRGCGSFRHVMIAHRISPPKKALLIRTLGLSRTVDVVLVYSTAQRQQAERLFKRTADQVRLIDFMVDTEFFRPTRELAGEREPGRRPVICAAGREFRDYPTLIEAVRGLDVDVVIASASPWSKRSDNAREAKPPENVVITRFSQAELREQLDRSDMLVMPLQDVDFQAGITTILEAMAMERPVICTRTIGQTDVVVDGVNGLLVPPANVAAMRKAILELIEKPELAAAMGKNGRRLAIERADVRFYAERFGAIVDELAPRGPIDQGLTDLAG